MSSIMSMGKGVEIDWLNLFLYALSSLRKRVEVDLLLCIIISIGKGVEIDWLNLLLYLLFPH